MPDSRSTPSWVFDEGGAYYLFTRFFRLGAILGATEALDGLYELKII